MKKYSNILMSQRYCLLLERCLVDDEGIRREPSLGLPIPTSDALLTFWHVIEEEL